MKYAKSLLLMALAIAGISTTAHAYKEADLQKLKTTGNCRNCDLSGASFGAEDYSKADLSGADLTDTAWGSTNLTDADLTGANLNGGVFYRVNFTGATFTNARTRWALFFLCKGR